MPHRFFHPEKPCATNKNHPFPSGKWVVGCKICSCNEILLMHKYIERKHTSIKSQLRRQPRTSPLQAIQRCGLFSRRQGRKYNSYPNPKQKIPNRNSDWGFWQRMRDSNPRKRSQSPVCYRYTNPLFLERFYYTHSYLFVKPIFPIFQNFILPHRFPRDRASA